VFSSSNDIPLKQANFPLDLIKLEGATQYSDWQFDYVFPKKTSPPINKTQKQ